MTDVIAGRFALCDPIARGGSGVVWRAFDRKTGQFCAAKVLRRRDAGDLLRFVREQSVRMSHDHVLTPYSWAAEDTHVVIASELVDGGSVSSLITRHGPLAEATVAALLGQLLQALNQVHAAGLVHRDVKPANLLLQATGTGPLRVMLGDFGLAMGVDDAHLTQTGTVVGTPGYLPPELLYGGVTPHPVHDLYAAGRVAAALATGREPARVDVPTDLSGFGPGPLRDAVAALGALDPRVRPHSAADAQRLLAGVPADPVPRTRDGAVIDIVHQLPPLSPEALAEADGAATGPLGGAIAAGATHAFAPTPDATVDGTQPIGGAQPIGDTRIVGDTRTLPRHAAGPAGPPRRRRSALLAGGVLAAAAIATSVVLTMTGGSDAGSPPSPTPTPTRTTGGTFVVSAVRVGDLCDFTDEGDQRKTSNGAAVTCRRVEGGAYRWSAS